MIIYFIISFILDGYILSSSIFYPLFTLVSIIVTYQYFNKKSNNYLIVCFILGLLYDVVYTNTFLLNGLIFVLLGYLIKIINKKIHINSLTIIFETIIIILGYRTLNFIILNLSNYNIELIVLFKSFYESIILNIIYVFITYNIWLIIRKK